MYLKKLTVTNFKNYSDCSVDLSPGVNCFVGNNGVGKTNILDAIHYISLSRSFFNSIESQSVRFGEDFFIIQGVMSHGGGEESISCSYRCGKQKVLRHNGKEYERFSDHIGKYPAVMISPSDGQLITGGSEERRRFINLIISQYDSSYLNSLMAYNRALQSRNRLLKDSGGRAVIDDYLLESLDSQLVKHGTAIYSARVGLIEKMVPVFRDFYSDISMEREAVELRYRSQLNERELGELLLTSRERDSYLQYTSCGVHKDDLEFLIGEGKSVKQTGSQGQQKSYLVALKLAKYDYISNMSGRKPMLLLDDLFDKFDADRVEQLIRMLVNRKFGQIFITDTHSERLRLILDRTSSDYYLYAIDSSGVCEVVQNGISHEKKQD